MLIGMPELQFISFHLKSSIIFCLLLALQALGILSDILKLPFCSRG